MVFSIDDLEDSLWRQTENICKVGDAFAISKSSVDNRISILWRMVGQNPTEFKQPICHRRH